MTERVVRSFVHGNSAAADRIASIRLDDNGTCALVGPESAVYAIRDGDVTIRFTDWYSRHASNTKHGEALRTLDSYATMDVQEAPTTNEVLEITDGFLTKIGQQLRPDGLIAFSNEGP